MTVFNPCISSHTKLLHVHKPVPFVIAVLTYALMTAAAHLQMCTQAWTLMCLYQLRCISAASKVWRYQAWWFCRRHSQ